MRKSITLLAALAFVALPVHAEEPASSGGLGGALNTLLDAGMKAHQYETERKAGKAELEAALADEDLTPEQKAAIRAKFKAQQRSQLIQGLLAKPGTEAVPAQ